MRRLLLQLALAKEKNAIMQMIFNDDSKFGSPIEENAHWKNEGSIYQKILTKYGIDAQLSHFAQEFAEA
ncbi:MAG: hypothetical protein KAJ03_06620, partial [Gammaproteobacteria bacterium]|nr:hypothetical protein [Gammaproteobacteria bacterium]